MNNIKIDEKTNERLKNKLFLFLVKSLYKKGFISCQEYDSIVKKEPSS